MREYRRLLTALALACALVASGAQAAPTENGKKKKERAAKGERAEKSERRKESERRKHDDADEARETIAPAVVAAPPPARPANGALFTDDSPQAGLFSDFKARRIGDLIFIDVVEAASAQVESGAQRKRDSGALAGVGTLAGALPLPGAAVAGAVAGALGARKYEGKGSTGRNSRVEARIAARVVEVLPNGDLRVEASKLVKVNKEDESLHLSGIVRPNDVSADNSVATTEVGDLRVELSGKGVASADNAPGWLFRLFEKISPF